VAYAFTPVLVDDGNYDVRVRAIDTSGNVAAVVAGTLVIDRLPPRLSGGTVAVGPQMVPANASGRWPAVVGVDQEITLGAVGGPTAVNVVATKAGMKRVGQSFALRQNDVTGLWEGIISFRAVGAYHLVAEAVDGAGNHVTSALSDVAVSPAAVVTAVDGKRVVSGAKATLYVRRPDENDWAVWDGAAFGQLNSQTVRRDGTFRMMVPVGTYYLKVEASGYRTLVSHDFTLGHATSLVPAVRLEAVPGVRVGPWTLRWPWPAPVQVAIQPEAAAMAAVPSSLVGQPLPAFDLPTTNGVVVANAVSDAAVSANVTKVGLLGKPTLLTTLATWAASTNEQMPVLAALQTHDDINVVALVSGERVSRVRSFLKRGGYEVRATVDASDTLTQYLGVPDVPTHYLMDRDGIVRAVVPGVMNEKDLLAALLKL
jgi:cytochrome c biogenesis protein CcmG/thiol:disulfide interchange protein DsbE